jgi:hypothetical protein
MQIANPSGQQEDYCPDEVGNHGGHITDASRPGRNAQESTIVLA